MKEVPNECGDFNTIIESYKIRIISGISSQKINMENIINKTDSNGISFTFPENIRCPGIEADHKAILICGGTARLCSGELIGWSIQKKDGMFETVVGIITVSSPILCTPSLEEAQNAIAVAVDGLMDSVA